MNKYKAATATAAVSLMLLTAGCATGPNRKPEDPFEPANRVMFKFNDKLDRTIAQPVARGYQKVTPQPLREAISSFFSNIGDVGNFANSLLQLKITEATETLMRIAINSVFGVAGMFDIATAAGLPKHSEDFGLTLGRYGMPAGPYIVLPVFGPSSVRDGIGMGVDVTFNLFNYIEPAVRNPMYVAQFISARSDMLGATDLLQQAALDQYSFVRDAYRQQRESRLRGGTSGTSAPALPDYGDPGETGDANAPGATGAAAGAEGAGAAAAAGAAGTAGTAAGPQPAAKPAGASEVETPAPASAASVPAAAPAAASAPDAVKQPAQPADGTAAPRPEPASH